MLSGARVLVTGAGGSIGQELCRQIRSHDPAALLHARPRRVEHAHAPARAERAALLDSDEIIIADIRDETRIRQVFRAARPDVVFHAAAHKHLPLLEQHPGEGVKTNVLGTQNVVARGGRGRDEAVPAHLHRQGRRAPVRSWARPSGWPRWSCRPTPTARCASARSASATCSAAAARCSPWSRDADRARRAGHRDRSRRHAVLHDRRGGGGPGPVGGADGASSARRSCWTWASRCGSSTWSAATPSSSGCRTCRSTSPGCGPARSCTRPCSASVEQRLPTVNPAISATRHRRLPGGLRRLAGNALRRGRGRR